jgi:hypothetical protein
MEHFIEIGRTMVATGVTFALGKVFEYLIKGRQERRQREEAFRRLEERLCRVELRSLKCIITNRELSFEIRHEAYDEYKKLGGNSWVDGYVLKHLIRSED